MSGTQLSSADGLAGAMFSFPSADGLADAMFWFSSTRRGFSKKEGELDESMELEISKDMVDSEGERVVFFCRKNRRRV